MKRVRRPSALVAAVAAEVMAAVVAAVEAAAAIAAAVVGAAADAAAIAAIVETAATAGKIPHLSLSPSLTSGALLLRQEIFCFQQLLLGPVKFTAPSEFVLANPSGLPC